MEQEGFIDNVNKKFDTTFQTTKQQELSALEGEVALIEQRKNEIVEKTKTMVFKDQQYLEGEIKDLISSSKTVIRKLEADIKIGSPPKMYEVYSYLLNAMINQYRELREMNKMIANMEFMSGAGPNINDMNEGDKITLTADQLLDVVDKARENSQLKAIDAEFEVEEE